MANRDHTRLLRTSVQEWNVWRKVNPTHRPDLHAANLRGAVLTGANLRGADCRDADFREATCLEADFRGATFRKAVLKNAIFDGADLTGANFRRAFLQGVSLKNAVINNCVMNFTRLEGADLSGAHIRGADIYKTTFTDAVLVNVDFAKSSISNVAFQRTRLRGSDFSRVKLHDIIFDHADLSDTRGFDTSKMSGQNRIDNATLRQSGTLSMRLLLGFGLDENVVVSREAKAISIAFRREVWAQLLPIESALAATLGDKFTIEKQSDGVTITLESPELLQSALDAVLPVLASLHVAAPGEIVSVTSELQGINPQLLAPTNLQDQLAYLVQRFDEEMPADRRKLTNKEELAVKLVESGFRGAVAEWLRRWLESPSNASSRIFAKEVFLRFKRYLFAAKEIENIPRLRANSDTRQLVNVQDPMQE